MAELGDYFKAREIIIPGSVVTPVREQPGSNITFTRLGSGGATPFAHAGLRWNVQESLDRKRLAPALHPIFPESWQCQK